MIVGGYVNGHVGISREAIERIHGGWGVRKELGRGNGNIFCDSVNTFFEKRTHHQVAYKSWGEEKVR